VWATSPGGEYFLATVFGYCSYSALLDLTGRIRATFWHTSLGCNDGPFEAEGITGDGYVVGVDARDVGGESSSTLVLADPDAKWRARVQYAPMGYFISCAATGNIIAFEDSNTAALQIGALTIDWK